MPRSLARQWGSPWTRDLCKPLIQVELRVNVCFLT